MPRLTPFPNAAEIMFKPKYVERYSQLTDWETYKKYSLSFLPKSIRINTLKKSVDEIKKRLSKDWVLEQIPWCREGFWIEHKKGRLDVGNTIEHCLGYYYVQEGASMIPPVVLDPQPGERVLDLCAAPGSKSSQIVQMMKNKGVLVANDVAGMRIAALGINLQRLGALNCIITQKAGEHFRGVEFDRVLLDAPCSGSGTIRKSVKTLTMWNSGTIKSIAGQQRRLIQTAFDMLKKGGTMVYSTCSVEPEENEGVISFFLKNNSDAVLDDINLPLKRTPCLTEFEGEIYHPDIRKCLRLWPQDNDTEGFFVAKIIKKGSE